MSRIILSVLRKASEPLTMRDIALRALDKRLMTFGSESRSGETKRVVRCDQGPGQYMLWEIPRVVIGDN